MLLPFVTETMTITRPADEVVATVAAATERQPLFANMSGGEALRPFVGEVNAASFLIRRRIAYRNPFVPVIEGRVLDGAVTLLARPTWPSLTAVIVSSLLGWSFLFGAGADPLGLIFTIAPWLMLAVGYGIEAGKAERLLVHMMGSSE